MPSIRGTQLHRFTTRTAVTKHLLNGQSFFFIVFQGPSGSLSSGLAHLLVTIFLV